MNKNYKINLLTPQDQGNGQFDNGKITEIKPIDFPGGTGKGRSIGTLFYWAWASANGDGLIAMHPHQAFEIISYVIDGEIGHTDSLGNMTRVGKGGAQLMQAGSGLYHQEEMYGEKTEFFQIWFEPDLKETIKDHPVYKQFTNEEFPVERIDGVEIKQILDGGSPALFKADSRMRELSIKKNSSHVEILEAGRVFAIVILENKGEVYINDVRHAVSKKDYIVIAAEEPASVQFAAGGLGRLKLMLIDVPQKVDYKLWSDR